MAISKKGLIAIIAGGLLAGYGVKKLIKKNEPVDDQTEGDECECEDTETDVVADDAE